MKLLYSFFALMLLPVSLSFAQSSGTTTNPVSTTSTNRQQELYDQYHGITKKTPSTVVTTPGTKSTGSQQQSTNYGTTTPMSTPTSRRPQVASSVGDESRLRIGARGGVTYLILTENQPFIDPNVGFVGGLTLNFGVGTLSFQPEVNYARYSLKGTNLFTGAKATAAFDQVEVPLFLKISTGSYGGNRFFVNVGPYGSYLASVSIDGKKQAVDSSSGRFHFGAAAGVGTALKAGPGHVTVEVRGLYQFGTTQTGFSSDSKTVLMQGTIGYSFPLGGR